jgi:hypothetical protein
VLGHRAPAGGVGRAHRPVQAAVHLFRDSLRFDYAIDRKLMPNLSKLLPRASGEGNAMLLNMTVHWWNAFSGIDAPRCSLRRGFQHAEKQAQNILVLQMKKTRRTHYRSFGLRHSLALQRSPGRKLRVPEGHIPRLCQKSASSILHLQTYVTIVHLLDRTTTARRSAPTRRRTEATRRGGPSFGEVWPLAPSDHLMVLGDTAWTKTAAQVQHASHIYL